MQFKEGAKVVTAGGEPIGSVDRVVIDPRNGRITHLVVRKGLLFPDDRVLPADLVETTTEDEVVLKRQTGDLERSMPPFEVEAYVAPGEEEAARLAYPPSGPAPLVWAPTYSPYHNMGFPAYPVGVPQVEVERNIPDETVALKEGAQVIAANGESVGNVEQVLTSGDSQRVSYFVIAHGLLSRERKLLPVQWIDHLDENEVHLAVGSHLVDRLPAFDANS